MSGACTCQEVVLEFMNKEAEFKTFKHNDLTREYVLYKPPNLPDNAPLVFGLHGYGSHGIVLEAYSEMDTLAEENGFAVVYPQGAPDYANSSHWNSNLQISTVDDVGFLTELAKHLQSEHNLNPEKTFIFGHSNGGFMGYTLSCKAPGVFKAIASVAGTMSGSDWKHCKNAKPVSVLHIHGIQDQVVPIDGSMSPGGGWGGAPHADEVISFWAKVNQSTITETAFFEPNINVVYYKNPDNKHEIWYYKIDDLGHDWPGALFPKGTVTSEVIWQFFSRV